VVVSLVLSAATSLRGAGRALGVIQECAGLVPWSPSWASTRLWLLRLGYYKLTRVKEEGSDWVWIVDHVVQAGQEKCLLIVGIRLSGPSHKFLNVLVVPVQLLSGVGLGELPVDRFMLAIAARRPR
jgi:hypothetical protein